MFALALVEPVARVARAADPLNTSDRAAASAPQPARGDTQLNIVPVVGGTTDIGAGVGEFAGITRVRKGHDPYVWNLESAGLVTFKLGNANRLLVPYQDIYLKLTVPRIFGAASELQIMPEYTTETTLGYYGIGNASTATPPPGMSSSYFWYSRTHPTLPVELRWRLVDHLIGVAGVRYTQNWMTVPAGSKLAVDQSSGSAEVRSFLGPTAPHGVATFTYGLRWDDRDSNVSPHTGSFHDGLVRLSPGGTTAFPYRYGETTVDSQVFVPLARRLTLALRAVGDLLFGDPPIYALPRVGEDFALGGPNGVRGIPTQRYAGKVKVFGTTELRADVVSFHALGKPMRFGLVGFFDGGRVWADVTPHPDLDGHGIGLKYGVGGGVRLQSGTAFVLRGDLAWSPDAQPIGAYFAAGQSF